MYIVFYVYSTHFVRTRHLLPPPRSLHLRRRCWRFHLSTSRIILHICLGFFFPSVLLSFFIFSFILFRMLYEWCVYGCTARYIRYKRRTPHPILVHICPSLCSQDVCRNGRHKIMGHSLYMEAIPYRNHRRQRRQ